MIAFWIPHCYELDLNCWSLVSNYAKHGALKKPFTLKVKLTFISEKHVKKTLGTEIYYVCFQYIILYEALSSEPPCTKVQKQHKLKSI